MLLAGVRQKAVTVVSVAVCLALCSATSSPATANRGAGSLSGPGTPYLAVDWPTFHNTIDRVGYNPSETILNTSNVNELTKSWSFDTGGEVASSPAVVGGTLYIGSADKKVYALNATTGVKIWSYATLGEVRSSPTVVGGVVYVGSNDDKLYALNASTGTKIWSAATTGDIATSSPLVVGGTVFIGSRDGFFYAFNTSNGSLKWQVNTWSVWQSAAYANGSVFVGSDASKLYSLDPSTGATNWSATLGGRVRCTPSVSNGVVYVGADDYRVYAYDAVTGGFKWKSQVFPDLGIVRSSPAVYNNTVYIDTGQTSPMGSSLYALDATTGATKWSTSMGDYATASPAVANGVVYTGSFDHQLYAFDAVTGTKLWNSGFNGAMEGGVQSSPAVVNGWVYVGSNDSLVYAFTNTPGDPVTSYVSMTDNVYTPKDTTDHEFGTAVMWTNDGNNNHTVTDNQGMGLYDSGTIAKNGTFQMTIISAGIFKYYCTIHTSMTGTVKSRVQVAPSSGHINTLFTITWASVPPPPGFDYDVRIKHPGDTAWSMWKTNVTTMSATFDPNDGTGTYQFQAHIQKTSNGKSATYSGAISITVT